VQVEKIDFLSWKKLIKDGASLLGIHVTEEQAELFATHAWELLIWNRKVNLTSITDPLEIAVKHFLDSIASVPLIEPDKSILDIGSGGGFPGIPLKIMFPSNLVFLIDASRKKTAFLKHLVRLIKLQNITAHHVRAENLSQDPKFKNRFDVIICRALTDLKTFVEMASPLLSNKGFLLAYKGNLTELEIEEMMKLNKRRGISNIPWDVSTRNYHLPFLDQPRSLVIIKRSIRL
jgi:16S rRNA (guanine527-N7)-methyltransferase